MIIIILLLQLIIFSFSTGCVPSKYNFEKYTSFKGGRIEFNLDTLGVFSYEKTINDSQCTYHFPSFCLDNKSNIYLLFNEWLYKYSIINKKLDKKIKIEATTCYSECYYYKDNIYITGEYSLKILNSDELNLDKTIDFSKHSFPVKIDRIDLQYIFPFINNYLILNYYYQHDYFPENNISRHVFNLNNEKLEMYSDDLFFITNCGKCDKKLLLDFIEINSLFYSGQSDKYLIFYYYCNPKSMRGCKESLDGIFYILNKMNNTIRKLDEKFTVKYEFSGGSNFIKFIDDTTFIFPNIVGGDDNRVKKLKFYKFTFKGW